MLKKQKYAILSFIIIVGIFLFGIKLPDFANAVETDRSELIKKLVKISVLQDGEVIPQSGINLNKSIDVKLEFKLPVKGDVPAPAEYVNKGDSAVISLGTGVKLTPASTTHITKEIKVNGTGLKIGEVTFKPKAAGSDEMVAEFQFNGDASVYDGSNRGVEVKAGVEFAIETKDIDPNNLTNKTITVLGKEYKVNPKLDDTVTIEKKHKVKPKYIEWTLVVSRSAIGINKKLDLAGLKIRDNLEGVTIQGNSSAEIKSAIENSFYVNGIKRIPEYSIGRKELTYTFQQGDTDANGCATVTFTTYMGDNYVKVYDKGGKLYKNTADVMDRTGKQRDSAEDSFKWPGFAEKDPKKQPDNKFYRKDGIDYYVDWNIDFNLNGDDLHNVKIVEPMPSDAFANAKLEFVSAAAVAWNETDSDFDIAHPVKSFDSKASDDTYEIGNVTTKMRFLVTTKVIYNTGVTKGNYCKFINIAKVTWDEYKDGVQLSGVVNVGVKPVKKGVVQITSETKYQSILPFETEWEVYVEKNSDPHYYDGVYAYDLMIFDEKENISKLGDTDNPVTFKEEGLDTVATPQIISLSKINRDNRHQRYISGSFSKAGSNHLNHKIYRVFRGEKHVGDLLEVWGFKHDDSGRNRFTLKTILQEPDQLIKKTEKANLFNGITLVKGDKKMDYDDSWPTFYTKILKKQAMGAVDAKALLNNFSPSLANINVFNDTDKKFIDNKDSAYNKEDHSILYRININGSSMYNIGDLELSDAAPKGWEFDNIEGNNKFLIYDGESYTEAYLPDATVKALHKISAPNNDIDASVTSGSAIFKFKNINKPYVVFLKIKMKDTREYLNKKEVVENEATVKLGKNETTDRQLVTVDEQFLTKQVDDSNLSAGYVTWTIKYKPYGFLTADSVILEDVLGEGLEIRRYSDNRGLLFENNNFKVKKGSTYLTGEDLKNFFRYDAGTRKLTFALDNRNEEYEISYITDIVDKNVKEKLHNTVTVLEGSNKIEMEPKEAVYTVANAYANATLKGFQRIKIVKTDKDGTTKLKGAEFSMLNKADRTVYTSATTDENGILYLRKLIDGEYILKETKAPEGYVADGKEYQVKIEEKKVADRVEMEVTLDGTVLANNEITIKNEKKPVTPVTPVTPDGGGGGTPPTPPTDPSKPTEPNKPTDPSKPIEPSKPTDPLKPVTPKSEDNPEDPEDPEDPDTPTPTPSIPSYPLNRTPNPNDPNSPDEITVVSDDGTPLGKFVKKKKPNGEFEYVDADDGTPLASFKFPNDIPRNLPKTGGADTVWYYISGAGILIGAGFVFRKRKEIF